MHAERWTVLLMLVALAACGAKPQRPAPAAAKPAATATKPKSVAAAATPATRPAPATAKAPPAADRSYGDALAKLKANQFPEAEQALLAAARTWPQLTGPHTNLGIVYARTNRKTEAAAAFAKAVAVDPANAVAHNWLGVLAREAGDLRRAETAYKAALAAQPDLAQAQLNLALLYDQHLKRPADALAAYRRYHELTGRKDLRVAVWMAELEAQLPDGTTTAAPVTPAPPAAAKPAPARPTVSPPTRTGTKS